MKQKNRSWLIIILLFMVGIAVLPTGLILYFADMEIGDIFILFGALCLIISIISAIMMIFTIVDKKCPQCGKNIPSNSKFCLECGQKLN